MPKLLAKNLSFDEFNEQKASPKSVEISKTPPVVVERTSYEEYDANPDDIPEPFDYEGFKAEEPEPTDCIGGIKAYFTKLGPYPICMIVSGYVVTWLMLGEHALPGGVLWGTGLLWLVATFVGARAEQVGLPPLVGMILGGFILRNVRYK